jgi:hypothetical protein
MIKHAKDKDTCEPTDKYPPTFKMNLPFCDGKFACEVYDDKRNLIDLNDIQTKGARVTALIQCTGIWLAGGKFGRHKKREKFAVFEKIYEQCQQRIVKYAHNEKYRFFFEVPEFIIGLPVFNLNAAIIYLMDKTLEYVKKGHKPNFMDLRDLLVTEKTKRDMVNTSALPKKSKHYKC